jgi:hypothetical protein
LVLLAAAPAVAQATWTQVPSPNRPGSNELQGAAGADTSHVWAVGRVVDTSANPSTYRSLILRWNGSAWAPAPHPSFARNHALRGVAAAAADDAWAVGTWPDACGYVDEHGWTCGYTRAEHTHISGEESTLP